METIVDASLVKLAQSLLEDRNVDECVIIFDSNKEEIVLRNEITDEILDHCYY